jgi:methylated-DNA-protein-cysteine methyltransferase-like protein
MPRKPSPKNKAIAPTPDAAWEAICKAIERIPKGSVSTYGTIARVAGLPRRARLVGTVLKNVPSARKLPWHRVITASGRLAFPERSDAFAKQRARLAREGVAMSKNRIDLQRYGWPRSAQSLDELLWG